ncbi:hypothetical protein P4129_06530 [Pseudomonas aeruginosa]|nr:hypothetical protein [Pseudomonas aeruginosa]
MRRARSRRELPYAAIPLLFGVQQLLEGMLWLTFPDRAPLLNVALTHLYSFFSHVLWPIYVPLAALALESVRWRRRVLVAIAVAGALVGLYLLAMLVKLPITARVVGQHILYDSPHFYVMTTMALYLIGTCANLMVSSHRRVAAFGVAAFVSAIAAYMFYATWFISVWCFFAAVLSFIVLWQFREPRARLAVPRRILRPDSSPHWPTRTAAARRARCAARRSSRFSCSTDSRPCAMRSPAGCRRYSRKRNSRKAPRPGTSSPRSASCPCTG